MSRIRDAFLNKITKSKVNNKEQITNNEKEFNDQLEKFAIFAVDSPIKLFINTFKYENLELKYKSKKDSVERKFMILSELQEMLKDQEDTQAYLHNLLKIIKRQDLQLYRTKLNFKNRQVNKIADENTFNLPKNYVLLQKKGKLFRKVELRDCYMTTQAFGQIKNKDKKRLYKPVPFRDQYVYLETKSRVMAEVAKEKSIKKKGMEVKKTLKWPDKKDLDDYNIRLRFVEMKKDRQRAIYVTSVPFAINLKNHTIIQRVIAIDPNKKVKLNVIKSIWKIKQAEYFYNNYLKRFFRDPKACKGLIHANDALTNKVKVYLKENFPNLYDSQYDPNKGYNFHDNSHLDIKKKKEENEHDPSLEVSKHIFATRIGKQDYIKPSTSEILKNKKAIHLRSPFESIDETVEFNSSVFTNFLESFSTEARPSNILNTKKEAFIRHIVKNSKLILNFNKMVIKNVFNYKGCNLPLEEVNQMLFKFEVCIDKGNVSSDSLTLIDEIERDYIVFDMENSLKVDFNNLSSIKIKITNLVNDKLVLEKILNLQDKIDNIYLENTFFREFEFEYKGNTIEAIIQFMLIFIPRNLETAHLTLEKESIDENFDKFMTMLKFSEDYPSYKQNFSSEALTKKKLSKNNFDLFYFMSNCLRRSVTLVNKQENLFCNSYKVNDTDLLKRTLKTIMNRDNDLNEILLDTVTKTEANEKMGISPFFDLQIETLGLISPVSRLLLHQIIFNHYSDNYIDIEKNTNNQGYHQQMIKELTSHINKLLVDEYDYLQSDEKHLVYKLTYEVYLLFDNNNFAGKKLPIKFSREHIPLIIKIVQTNSFDLTDEQLRLMIINQILSGQRMKNYTDSNHLMYIDSMIIYFKILFKSLYPDFYRIFTNKMMNFDFILAKMYMNSYASYFDAIYFNMYNDLKHSMNCILLIQEQYHGFLTKLKEIGITFGSLFDILFSLQGLVSNSELFNDLAPSKFITTIENCLSKESYNLKEGIKNIIKLLDYLNEQEFLKKDFLFFTDITKQRHNSNVGSYKNLMLNLKTAGITKKMIKDIVDKEIVKNDVFSLRAQTIYDKHNTSYSKTINDSMDQETEANSDEINEDIYFEIADDFEEEWDELDNLQKKQIFKYTGCLIYLHNLDYSIIETLLNTSSLKSDFNNILELDLEETSDFLEKYFKLQEVVQMEIYNDLSNLSGSKKVSLLRLLVIMICSYTEDNAEILENLNYLASRMTEIFYNKKETAFFNEAIMYIIDELYNLTPITYFKDFMHNLIENHTSNQYCYVKTAQLVLDNDIIDILQICIKHFSSSTFTSGKPSLIFNEMFCKDIQTVFSDLIHKNQLKPSFSKFTLFLEVSIQENVKSYSIPFKISFVPETLIFCKLRDPLNFDKLIGEKNLLERNALEYYYNNSPFTFLSNYTSLKLPVNFLNYQLLIKYRTKKEVFLTLKINLKDSEDERTCSNLAQWFKPTPDVDRLVKFSNPEIELDIHYTYLFLNMDAFHKYISILVTENLDLEDVFKFIKLNNERHTFTTIKNKDIPREAHFFELADFDIAFNRNEPFVVSVNYKN